MAQKPYINPDLEEEYDGWGGSVNPDLQQQEDFSMLESGLNPDADSNPLAGLGTMLAGGNDYIQGLKTSAEEAAEKTAQQRANFTGLMNQLNEDDLRRAEELKPRFTQQELDDRRAKSTAVSMLTSALANIANGIAVSRGGLNATVPDGYKAAYEHWNDVQKRHDARTAEYQKIIDRVNQRRVAAGQAELGWAEQDRKEKQAAYQGAMMQAQKAKDAKELQQIKTAADLYKIAAKGEEDRKTAEIKGQYNKQVATINSWNRGKSNGGSKSEDDLEDLRTISRFGGDVTIPDDVDVEEAYMNMTKNAIGYLKFKELSTKDKKEREAIGKQIAKLKAVSLKGNIKEKRKAIQKAIGLYDAYEIPNEVLTYTKESKANNSNTSSEGSGFKLNG